MAWEQYQEWQRRDWSVIEKINGLLTECQRHPFTGTGKPEPLKNELSGFWSRRINREHRLVYRVSADAIYVLHCEGH